MLCYIGIFGRIIAFTVESIYLNMEGGDTMKLDLKQTILVAIYTEYQKDLPEMNNITKEMFEIDDKKFTIALQKLENEQLIHNVHFMKFDDGIFTHSQSLTNTMMTNDGIDYIENVLGIQPTLSGAEKAKAVASKVGEWGFEQLKDFAVKVAGEMLKVNF